MALKPTKQTASIVLLGAFNPAIFHPSWLAAKELVLPEAAEKATATLKVVARQVSEFTVGGIKLLVLSDRFSADAVEVQDHPRMRDLVVGVFTALPETRITRMGFNWTYEYELATTDLWHAVGDRLAPKEAWVDLLPGRPGLKSMTMQGQFGDSGDTLNVEVTSTVKSNGVALAVNNDFVLPSKAPASEVEYFLQLIRSRWDKGSEAASTLVETLMQKLGAF